MGKQYDNAIDFCELTFRNWDPDKFDWKYRSWNLARYCPDKFDIWWDAKRFNWGHCIYLCIYLPDKFDIWWNPKKCNRKCKDYYLENFQYTEYFCKHILHKITMWYTLENIDKYIINKFINNLEWNYD